MKKSGLALFAILWLMLSGCDENAVYKGIEDIEDGTWYVNRAPEFTFQIKDTTATYSIHYIVRNSISYPYFNLYIRRYLLDDAGKTLDSRLDELTLLDPKSGKPYGDGLGDLFDHRINMVKNYRFAHAGTYTVRLRQYMRQNPLPEIYSVGITVEKEVRP
ncbi:gliding motility lipoprotein GldH [Larkinella soli]|uniref:gliding motility lipoprotein GldH n=1 Tax=Larkinella soli TaxID=1770527 RepID=UPI000FFBC6E5|nr:gliding motility lipoprotein GldH [Larkinella soli]